MRKRFLAICSVLITAIVLVAMVPGCDGVTCIGEIEVKATLCDAPWEGNVTYTLTGPGATAAPITGTNVTALFDEVECGNWTCAYVAGGPAGAYLVDITPSPTQSVSGGGAINFTLNFELEQDASIEFLIWTINGEPVTPNTPQTPYYVDWGDTIDVHYAQHVAGCQGKVVAVNETSELSIHYAAGVDQVFVYVANNWCAVVKEPEPIEKVSQVPSFNGEPVQPGEHFELILCQPAILDVETIWLLEKCTDYTKTINWLGISTGPEEHECVLFELPAVPVFDLDFTLVSSVEVELVDDEDVNPENNYAESPPLYLRVWGLF